jgi:hypothetical protein
MDNKVVCPLNSIDFSLVIAAERLALAAPLHASEKKSNCHGIANNGVRPPSPRVSNDAFYGRKIH